ncbi:DEAD/DEAH box helicase family protein [Endozoicomonas gorgoniicola]|uniref:DEAD/DEAH box helicase family protein n=1 Tax=Endozoicomonas gorgoniicola TaxID=1234144 RepID=UPI003898EDF9
MATTFETHNQRKSLLVMATGTGKTRTSIALVEKVKKVGLRVGIMIFNTQPLLSAPVSADPSVEQVAAHR